MLTKLIIRPSFTLMEVYGQGLLFNSRASFTSFGWLPVDQAVLDSLTGSPLTIAGDMPVLCSRSVVNEKSLLLLRKAGFEIATNIEIFNNKKDYLSKLTHNSSRVILQHVHPKNELAVKKYWILPELLSFLNNKANLKRLVPNGYVPHRKSVPLSSLFIDKFFTEIKPPVVIKAASDQSSGGGVGVRICRSEEDIYSAAHYFASCDSVVVEDFIPIKQNLCVQFVAICDRRIIYIGSAEQVIDDQGRYMGNWLDPHCEPPETAISVGKTIMEQAVSLGYRGFAGFDMALLFDGRILVFDLNFRLNGSTVALLFYESIVKALATPVLRHRSWQIHGSFGELLAVVQMAMDKGYLIPLSIYNPEESSYPNSNPTLKGLLLGTTREQVSERERQLAERGLI